MDEGGAAGLPSLSQVWALRPLVELHWRDWGADSVVLEARSAEVHQFDALAAAVMSCLEERPCRIPEIAAKLADDLQQPADEDFVGLIAEMVEHFQALGWVESIISA